MKHYIFLLLSFACLSQQGPDVNNKIGYIEDGTFKFTADTTELKKTLTETFTARPDTLSLDKIEIIAGKTIDEKHENYHILVLRDYSHKLKIARCLIMKENEFYLPIDTIPINDMEIFNATTLACYGTDDDCFPQIGIVDGQWFWGSSKSIICKADSKCITSKSI